MVSLFSGDVQDHLIKGGLIFISIAILAKYIYRLTWHPLAKFPGPKLAAASNLYGAFFDLASDTSYVKTFPALHDTYGECQSLVTHEPTLIGSGPIVRAWPNELHIRDLEGHTQSVFALP